MTQREYRLVVELFVESHYGAETPGTVSIRDPRLAVGHPHTVAVPLRQRRYQTVPPAAIQARPPL